jgi:Fe2+ or Zn2+ uptake regulation protein
MRPLLQNSRNSINIAAMSPPESFGAAHATRRFAWALARLRAAGHRDSRPRFLVLDVLARADAHLTAELVHARASANGSLDRSTVYRALALFERLQIVHTLLIAGRVTYGLADHPHAHTVCDSCARVTALRGDAWARVPALIQPHLDGFAPTRIVVRGHCGTCLPSPADRASESAPRPRGRGGVRRSPADVRSRRRTP